MPKCTPVKEYPFEYTVQNTDPPLEPQRHLATVSSVQALTNYKQKVGGGEGGVIDLNFCTICNIPELVFTVTTSTCLHLPLPVCLVWCTILFSRNQFQTEIKVQTIKHIYNQ